MVTIEHLYGEQKLVIDGATVELPHGPIQTVASDDVVIAVVRGWSKNSESIAEALGKPETRNPDFEIPDEERNVVGLDTSGTHLWTIRRAPDTPSDKTKYYHSVYSVGDDVWVRNENGFSYRVDEQTGEILETMPANRLRLGDTEVEFEGGDVDKLLKRDEIIVVKLANYNYDDPESRNIFAFTRDGEQLWQIGENTEQAFPTFSNIYEEDGELWAVNMNGYDYRLDWETGEPLDEQYTG